MTTSSFLPSSPSSSLASVDPAPHADAARRASALAADPDTADPDAAALAAFRGRLHAFVAAEIAPHLDRWIRQGHVDRTAWRRAGEAGFLCLTMPTAYGGGGLDYRYCAVFREEMARVGVSGTALGMGLQTDVIAPYILRHGTQAQRQRWLPGMASGEVIAALGMTERGAGSDLQSIATVARREDRHYRVDGSKIFITNGWQADVIVLVVKTDPTARARGVSLLLVETDRPGVRKGDPQAKLSLPMEDTCELFFEDVRVPVENILGRENEGYAHLQEGLPWERLQIALSAQCASEAVLEWTVAHARTRHVFGKPLIEHQNARFALADCATQIRIGRVFIDRCIALANAQALDNPTAAMAKLFCTELQGRVTDACLQLHGGYGVLWETPVARAYADARVQRIYGGANEIMKEIVARTL